MPKIRGCKLTMQRNEKILLSNGQECTVDEEIHAVQEERLVTPFLYESFELDSLHSLNASLEAICGKNTRCNYEPKIEGSGNVATNANEALHDLKIKNKRIDDSTMDISAQIERIKSTIQKAANETTICDPSYDDTQRDSQPNDTIADASEITSDFTETATPQQRAQPTAIVIAETNDELSNNNNERKALLNYFRKYDGSSTNAATRGRAISTDTFKMCLPEAALEQNFFSSRMLTDVTNTSTCITKPNDHHTPLFSSMSDNSNPFARFSAQPYNSKLRSWTFTQQQHSPQTDKQTNFFTSAAVDPNERRDENTPNGGNKEIRPPKDPSHKSTPAKHALDHHITGDRPDKAKIPINAFTRYMMEKRKTMKAAEKFETNEPNTFLSDDTTFLHISEHESIGGSNDESKNFHPIKALSDQEENKSSHRQKFDQMRYRRKKSSSTNPSPQKKMTPVRRGMKRKSPSNCKTNIFEMRNKNIAKSDGDDNSTTDEINIIEDMPSLEKDLRTIRTCPVCNEPMLGVISHYRRSHGIWDSKDRRKYFLRERIRIIKAKISRNYLKSKLVSYGVANDSTINAISEILDECGISIEEAGSKRIDKLKHKNEERKMNREDGPVTSDGSCKVKHQSQSNGTQTRKSSCRSRRILSNKCERDDKAVNKQTDGIAKQGICNDFSLQSMWISVDDIADKLI